jgi:periplasmic glucans biosynthesis protein
MRPTFRIGEHPDLLQRVFSVAGVALLTVFMAPAALAAGFGFEQVVAKAEALAKQPYAAPKAIPKALQELDYATYRQIRFKPEHALWRAADSRFQVSLVSPGLYYGHTVKIDVVDAEGVHSLAYDKQDFEFPNQKLAQQVPDDLGYAGFRLSYPLGDKNGRTGFLVFAGASNFSGIGRGNVFGLSARGIAVDTGLPSGEQFPSFVQYWLIRPDAKATAIKFYALLDGRSLTGAYQFVVYPGAPTRLQVKAVLFARTGVRQLGVAPLSSMFFYGSNTARPAGEWRPQVHDSGGLLIHNGSGEWLWRPLLNPRTLKLDYFSTDNVRGFGLLQRDTAFTDYQDAAAHYERRPSAWVTPDGNWGKGHVVLVEIPSSDETNDNIVAFWMPAAPVKAGDRLGFDYDIALGGPEVDGESMARVAKTFVGRGDTSGKGKAEGAYRFVVDFRGGPLAKIPPAASVQGVVTGQDGTQVIEHYVEYIPAIEQWRLSILAKPAADKPVELRAFLKQGGDTLSETWSYGLPARNRIGGS